MKNLLLLKKLISAYYYLVLIIFGIGLIAIPSLLFTGKKTEISFLDDVIDLNKLTNTKILIVLLLVGSLYFLYFLSIKLIKNTVDILSKGSYFTKEVIYNFKKAGHYFIIIGIGASIIKVIISLIINSELNLKLDGGMLVFILFGLFFMFLSEAFLQAQILKEDNDLTV